MIINNVTYNWYLFYTNNFFVRWNWLYNVAKFKWKYIYMLPISTKNFVKIRFGLEMLNFGLEFFPVAPKPYYVVSQNKCRVQLWNTAIVFHTPQAPSPYVTLIINLFLISRILANPDKVDRLSANGEILVMGIVSLL